ncbi:hypothetical protein Dimus_038091 [Dionaea muscipula]
MTFLTLSRHLSLSKEFVIVTSEQLDFSLTKGGEDPISFSGSLLETYEVLAKRLCLLKDIPLSISSVQPLDSGSPPPPLCSCPLVLYPPCVIIVIILNQG